MVEQYSSKVLILVQVQKRAKAYYVRLKKIDRLSP